MPVVEKPASAYTYGWQCWFCAKKWAASGERPTVWRETTCATLGKGECVVEGQFWSGKSNRAAAEARRQK